MRLRCLYDKCQKFFEQKTRWQKFCSDKCNKRHAYRVKHPLGDGDKFFGKCDQCSAEFIRMRDWQRFCNPKCKTAWFNAERLAAVNAYRRIG